ncbi:MAG: DUF1244 domain-containing protein [Hyphomonadaceae bacterium]|nr:DUF1244 domain-containing protein [Hyphomonadaceae bacterium]
MIVVCDHAGNALPAEYGTLGLPEAQLARHIAYDIGVAPIVRALAAHLNAPAIMTRYSRLLIDPNRGRDDPTLIMRLSDGAVIPGNRKLDAAERDKRLRLYYEPYHRAIDSVIDACLATGITPVLLSIHSFTESWKSVSRPWHVGVLWDRDARLARPLLESFYAEGGLIVGDNEPYTGQLEGDCLWQHGTQRGLANAIVEVRQDLIRDAAGQAAWSARLCRIVERILRDPHVAQQTRAPGARPPDAAGADTHSRQGEFQMTKLDKALVTELEAAAFRRLVEHLRTRSDVQNIDLMNLAGFCRNCLSNWYQEAATAKGLQLTKEGAREVIYGMPYKEWQAKFQTEASPEAKAAFAETKPHQH